VSDCPLTARLLLSGRWRYSIQQPDRIPRPAAPRSAVAARRRTIRSATAPTRRGIRSNERLPPAGPDPGILAPGEGRTISPCVPGHFMGGFVSGAELQWVPLLLRPVSGIFLGAEPTPSTTIRPGNRPDQQADTGRFLRLLTRRDARIFAGFSFLSGITTAAFVNPACLAVALVSASCSSCTVRS